MKRVLMLCYHYPPQGGVGCVRSVAFSRHLPTYGWEPHVLSVRNPARCFTDITGESPPPGVPVTYARNWFSYPGLVEAALRRLGVTDQVLVPDHAVCWIPGAILAGRPFVDVGKFDAVYVSCPPFSAALAASYLADRAGIPLVVDLRDAWTLNPYAGSYLISGLEEIDRGLEHEVLTAAAAVVTATEGIATDYRRVYPNIAAKFVCIPNGFDPGTLPARGTHRTERMTIVYTGSFYGERSPASLFRALTALIRAGRLDPDQIRFRWVGRAAPWVLALAEEHGLGAVVEYRGMLPKAEADAILGQADLLYLAIAPSDGENTTMTGKIYPYIAAGTPILATVPEGPAARLIREYSPRSTVVTGGECQAIKAAVLDAMARWEQGGTTEMLQETAAFRERYSYAARARDIAAVLDTICTKET